MCPHSQTVHTTSDVLVVFPERTAKACSIIPMGMCNARVRWVLCLARCLRQRQLSACDLNTSVPLPKKIISNPTNRRCGLLSHSKYNKVLYSVVACPLCSLFCNSCFPFCTQQQLAMFKALSWPLVCRQTWIVWLTIGVVLLNEMFYIAWAILQETKRFF